MPLRTREATIILPAFGGSFFADKEKKSKKVEYKYRNEPNATEPMRPSQKAVSTGIALAETLKHFAAAASFLFGTFSFAEKEKVHPQTIHKITAIPNEEQNITIIS